MTGAPPTRADRFEQLPPEAEAKWSRFVKMNQELYVTLLGLVVEEVKLDYCRMRMPFKTSLNQAAGVVHGGAIAGLLDSVVVPVVGGPLPSNARFSTVDMHVQYMSALIGEDAVAEGWAVKRGRTTVFCEAEVIGATSGKLVARSILTYNVSIPEPAVPQSIKES